MSVKVHEPVCLDSAQDLYFWFDHFLGDQIKDEWDSAGTGSVVVVDAQTGGIARLTTGAVLNDTHVFDWNDIRSLLVSKKVTMECRVTLETTSFIGPQIRLMNDVNNRVMFYVSGVNWFIYCRDAGGTTTGDSGIAIDADPHIFRMECHTHTSNHIHFYIDGVETANSPITTNITALYLQPYFWLQTLENATKYMDIDYVVVRQER